jgi:hypothetical protein
MEALASSEGFLFDDFRLDRRGGGLFRRDNSGAFAPVAIGSRGLDILEVLIARSARLFPRTRSSPRSGRGPLSRTAI